MDISAARIRILKIDKQIDQMAEEKKSLLFFLQKNCPHEAFISTPFIPETPYSNHHLERRLCLFCGLEEEDWTFSRINGKKLRGNPVASLTRDEFYAYRRLQPLTVNLSVSQLKKAVVAVPESIIKQTGK